MRKVGADERGGSVRGGRTQKGGRVTVGVGGGGEGMRGEEGGVGRRTWKKGAGGV